MTIIIMQCGCDKELVLAVNTETKTLMGYCPGCRKMYDILDVKLTDDDLVRVRDSVRGLSPRDGGEMLFYLRCTDLLEFRA